MKRPNILLIMTDQQRADSLGYARSDATDTPFLDRLAARGIIFDTAYSASTVCVPARSSLLTGLIDTRLPRGPNKLAIQEGIWTVPHALSAAGYETALFGKMHFSPIQANHGFQIVHSCEHLTRWAGYAPEDADDYGRELAASGLRDPRADPNPSQIFPHGEALHPTSWITRQAVDFLKRRSGEKPLFAVVSYTSPHSPFDPPARYASLYDPAGELIPEDGFESNLSLPKAFVDAFHRKPEEFFSSYRVTNQNAEQVRVILAWTRALVRQIDDAVGELMAHVSLDDTVVFFTSDHGDYGGHRGLLGKVPWIPFDDLARVPFFCVGSGVEGSRRVQELVQSADFALTSLELAGVEHPDPYVDFASLVPVLRGGSPPRDRAAFCALSMGWPSIRQGRFKLLSHWSGDKVLLDLESDPKETRNVAAEHPALVENLAIHLQLQINRPMFEVRVDR